MRGIRAVIALGTILVILSTSSLYFTNRLGWAFNLENRWMLFTAIAILIPAAFAGMMILGNATRWLSGFLYRSSAIIIGFLFYLLLSMLLLDLADLFLPFYPLVYGLAAVALSATGVAIGFWYSYQTKVITLKLPMKNLQKPIRLMHLTDVHLGHFRGKRFFGRIIGMTLESEVDLVLVTGDLFDGRIRLDDGTLDAFQRLEVPVYFVAGNHEAYTGIGLTKDKVRSLGIRVLENEVAVQDGIQLVGLNHMRTDANSLDMHGDKHPDNIETVLPALDIDPELPSILMHHSPNGLAFAAQAGIDLYLSGHTHAGQLFPVTLLNDLIFKYNRGLHELNGTRIYVSHGAGTFGPPMRVGTRSEITLIELTKQDSSYDYSKSD